MHHANSQISIRIDNFEVFEKYANVRFKNLLTWKNTVNITTAKVVVTNICLGGTIEESIISTKENPTAPRKPPYAVINCS